jgi:hypothetical protein
MEPGMNVVRDRCEIAGENVRGGVDPDRRFPRNVFVGDWSDFFFFDSDWMREPDFVDHVKAFLGIEGGHCACLWKLDSEDPNESRFFSVRQQTTANDYRALLAGKTPGYGWLDAMERLACASDSGEWCMYCEPNNEIAVIGFRHTGASARYSSAMSRFHATPIDKAIREPLSYGFSQVAAAPGWRDAFLREYVVRAL